MKNDIFKLFQDEKVWESLIKLSNESLAGDQFIKSDFSIDEINVFYKKSHTNIYSELIEEYSQLNFKESLQKFKEIIKFVKERTSIPNEKKMELFNQDLQIVQKKTLKWYQSKTKSQLTLEMIQSNPELNEKFNDHCLSYWLNRMNPVIDECQKGNYYNFEDKIYTNRSLML